MLCCALCGGLLRPREAAEPTPLQPTTYNCIVQLQAQVKVWRGLILEPQHPVYCIRYVAIRIVGAALSHHMLG